MQLRKTAFTTIVTRTNGSNTATYSLDANGNTISASGTLNEYFSGGTRSSSAFKTLDNDYGRYLDQGYQVEFTHALGDFSSQGRPGTITVNDNVIDSEGNMVNSYYQTFQNTSWQVYIKQAW
jgi:hypothetical protein